MTKVLVVLVFSCFIPLVSSAQVAEQQSATPTLPVVSTDQASPLDLIIPKVKEALDLYQHNLGNGPDALPALSSAEFDFKTTTAKTVGATVNLFIFKIGGSHEKDDVNETTFTYSIPPPTPPAQVQSSKKPPTLQEQLAYTIQAAALAVKQSKKLGPLSFTKFVVTIQFGVKWEGQAGVNVPISFVTVGLSGDISKNTVQSVKLTFGK
jgi:hypothetical protein